MQTAFNLEQEALASTNYLEQLVDPSTGFTYFDVFLTDPAEAVHDWPDFLDVPGRSAETCVLLRHMTGKPVATEPAFFRRILGLQEEDGLFHRPETAITRHEMLREEQALVMAALFAQAVGDADRDAEQRLNRLINALADTEPAPGPLPAMLIRPLVRAWEALGIRVAFDLASRLREQSIHEHPLFLPDGRFPGHVHSRLYAAAGLTELGRLTDDADLIAHMDRVYRVIRDRSTAFGFVPELTERTDDVIGCETCCLMDYIHLAIALTRTGRTEYFDDIERAVRNHLLESRVRSGDWLPERPGAPDEDLIRRVGVQQAVIGAYAGWSSPNHILAYDEYLPAEWIKSPELSPIYLNKVRALQNCCSPSGPKALYLAWQHAARVEGATLRVNLLMDRSLPEAEVRGYEPYEGRVAVQVRVPLRIALRTPGFARPAEVEATVNGTPVDARADGGYVTTPAVHPGDTVVFRYPLPEREETVTIGNAGFQQYAYTVTWRGSTVMRVEPGENAATGRSHLMAAPVRLYYGADGPHPLYRREGLLAGSPVPGPLHQVTGPAIW
ncbi:MAG: hypothetical protein HY320_07150 [Armatimonadetes bacterium]|nr:hypothetical protein [Armatimonadota bacterium]